MKNRLRSIACFSPLLSTLAPPAALCLCLLLISGCDPVDSDFFPLNEGNAWAYDWSQAAPVPPPAAGAANAAPASAPRMWTLTEDPLVVRERESQAVWEPAGLTSIILRRCADESTLIYVGEYRPGGGTAKISKLGGVLDVRCTSNLQEFAAMQLNAQLLTYPISKGSKWRDTSLMGLDSSAASTCRLVGFETVETYAGKFYQCAHVIRELDSRWVEGRGDGVRVQHFWLAPEVGIVKILYESSNGPTLRAELRGFKLEPMTSAQRDKQQAEIERTSEPGALDLPKGQAQGEHLTPEEMQRRFLYTVHDDYRR